MAEEVEIISAEDVKPGEIAKKMTFDGEEFEVLFAKGNPGKTREELEEIKRKAAESGQASDARWWPRWATARRTSPART